MSKALISAAYRQKLTELSRLGTHVVAVVPPGWREGGSTQPMEPLTNHDYDVIVTRIRLNGRFHLHYYPDLPKILRAVRPDLVHVDEEPYNLATYLAVRSACSLRIPSLFFSWQNLYRRYPEPFRSLERSVYRRVAHALAGSQSVVDVLRTKGYRGDITVVPQFGVDPDTFRPGPAPPHPFTVGFLNRLTPEKGPLLALNAFERLPENSRLLMVGDGPLFSTIEAEIEARGLGARVTLQPRVPSSHVPDLIRSLDAIVLPSISTRRWKEQFGRILIESMASGVPVVASDSGEIPSVLGGAGIIVPQADADALFCALKTLCDSPDHARRLGACGRERVLTHYTHALVARRTLDAYSRASGAIRQ